MPKKDREFPVHSHTMISIEQYGWLSRHGIMKRSKNIRFLIDRAIAEEKRQIEYIQAERILSSQIEKLEVNLKNNMFMYRKNGIILKPKRCAQNENNL
ncbi:MAG: hypothetical protein KKG76_00785 [Euryarchaeota archaeon]|nr:hypothetical protein [Euryarchaeota archaeon]